VGRLVTEFAHQAIVMQSADISRGVSSMPNTDKVSNLWIFNNSDLIESAQGETSHVVMHRLTVVYWGTDVECRIYAQGYDDGQAQYRDACDAMVTDE